MLLGIRVNEANNGGYGPYFLLTLGLRMAFLGDNHLRELVLVVVIGQERLAVGLGLDDDLAFGLLWASGFSAIGGTGAGREDRAGHRAGSSRRLRYAPG